MLCACYVTLCYSMLCTVMRLLVDLALQRIRCQGQLAASPTCGTVIACRIRVTVGRGACHTCQQYKSFGRCQRARANLFLASIDFVLSLNK